MRTKCTLTKCTQSALENLVEIAVLGSQPTTFMFGFLFKSIFVPNSCRWERDGAPRNSRVSVCVCVRVCAYSCFAQAFCLFPCEPNAVFPAQVLSLAHKDSRVRYNLYQSFLVKPSCENQSIKRIFRSLDLGLPCVKGCL